MKEVIIPEKIIPGGQALATLKSGKKVFIWNALPGEYISEYEILKEKSNYLEIFANRITKPSKYRVLPKDNIFFSTSPWQIINYDYELELKQELIVEIFREHNININLPEIFTDGKDYFYRNKMEYSLYWDKEENKIKLALHARGSHKKIPINTSSIERPEIFNYAKVVIDNLNSRSEILHQKPEVKHTLKKKDVVFLQIILIFHFMRMLYELHGSYP